MVLVSLFSGKINILLKIVVTDLHGHRSNLEDFTDFTAKYQLVSTRFVSRARSEKCVSQQFFPLPILNAQLSRFYLEVARH